jgi:dolichol-phosphate mannosyltransferase
MQQVRTSHPHVIYDGFEHPFRVASASYLWATGCVPAQSLRSFVPVLTSNPTEATAIGTPELSIVIPAIDERENLELLLPSLWEVLQSIGVQAEILVIDGGSHDGTPEAATKRGALVVRQQEPGYGGALMAGFAAARAPYVLTMDADLSHRPSFVAEMWRARDQANVLIASRYVPGGKAEMSFFRRILSKILNATFARVLSLPYKDLSSGFRMYHSDTLKSLKIEARDFDVLEEILLRIYAEGWSIQELPFSYMSRGSGSSHARLLKFGKAYLRTLLRMWRLRNSVDSADYDYRAFDSPIWLQRYWQRKRHEIILSFTAGIPDVLDIGCGSSRIILDLKEAVGMDILMRKLRFLKPRHDKLVLASTFALPFRDERFNVVINSQVIEHIPEDPAIMSEMWRVLRPGGTLILGTPDYGRWSWVALEWMYGKVLEGGYAHEHITHYTRQSLTDLIKASGFEVLDCQYVGYSEMIFKARKPANGVAANAAVRDALTTSN